MTEHGADRMEPGGGKKHRLPRKAGEVGGTAPGPNGRQVYPGAVERLIAEFAKLPGVGRRSAERLAFHVLKSEKGEALSLAQAVRDVKERVRPCPVCFNLTDAGSGPCPICADARRDRSLVLVVEQPKDLIALEQTGMFRGVYHVLMGHISPLEGIGPEALTAAELFTRVEESAKSAEPIKEVVLGLNPTVEGDGTALYLAEELRKRGVKVTRLARGLPSGGQLEYANKAVLADAVQHRQSVE